MLCPIFALRETPIHVLCQCKYLCFVAKVVNQCFDNLTVRQVMYKPVHLINPAPYVLLLSFLAMVTWSSAGRPGVCVV